MYLSDQTLAIIGSATGVLATVLGLVGRWLWSDLQDKKKAIEILQVKADSVDKAISERVEAVAKLNAVTTTLDSVAAERDKLRLDIESAKHSMEKYKQEADKQKIEAEKLLAAGQKEYQKRKAAEVRAEKAEFKAQDMEKAAKQREDELQSKLNDEKTTRDQLEKAQEQATLKANTHQQKVKELEKRLKGMAKQDGRVWQKPIPADAPAFVPLANRKKPIIISILNLKGGVGKTTITANLGGFLGAKGKRVLMIDCDHQRSLSQLLLSDAERVSADAAGRTLQRFLTSSMQDGKLLVATSHPIPNLLNCWVITNTDRRQGSGTEMGLDDLESHMMNEWLLNPTKQDVRFLMRGALHSEIVQEQFEFVLCDCPPRLTTASINALAASDFVIVPVQAEAVSIRSVVHVLLRLNNLRETGILPDLRLLGILANMVSGTAAVERLQTDLLDTVVATVAQNKVWTEPIRVFNTKLNRDDRYLKASLELSKGKLKLAIGSEVIEKQFAGLVKEIETAIRDCLGVAKATVS